MARATKEKPPTIVYSYGLLQVPVIDRDEIRTWPEDPNLMRMLRAGHDYGNASLEVERDRQAAVEEFWARKGGYAGLVTRLRSAQAIRLRKDDPNRPAHFKEIDALRAEIREKRAAAERKALPPEDTRRKLRAKEIKNEAKNRGHKLTDAQLTILLDQEPDCVSPRRRAQLEFIAQSRARGVEPSGKAMAAYLKKQGATTLTQAIDDRAAERTKQAREYYRVYYGTYRLIDEQVAQALKTAKFFPSFQKWTGEGRVGAPIDSNDGLSVESLHDCHFDPHSGTWDEKRNNTILQIDPNGDRCAKGLHTRMRMCVDSRGRDGSRRNPIWVEFRINFHRPLPPGAKICAAWINVWKQGTRTKYELQLQVQDESFRVKPRQDGSAVAINFGYRANGRVAYALDDTGAGSELRMDPRVLEGVERADAARSDRQLAANNMRDFLAGWAGEVGFPAAFLEGDGEREVPGWSGVRMRRSQSLATRIRALGDAREESLSKKLKGILRDWETLRSDGRTRREDESAYSALAAWFDNDKLLENTEAFTRTHVRHFRDLCFRRWAKGLCKKYGRVLIDGTDYAKLKMRPKDKDLMPIEKQTEIAQRRDVFAPGNLRRILLDVARALGVTVEKHDPSGLTQRHHACGFDEPWDALPSIEHQCDGCGDRFDQDRNFCEGLFERASGRLPSGPSRKPGTGRSRSDSGRQEASHAAE